MEDHRQSAKIRGDAAESCSIGFVADDDDVSRAIRFEMIGEEMTRFSDTIEDQIERAEFSTSCDRLVERVIDHRLDTETSQEIDVARRTNTYDVRVLAS